MTSSARDQSRDIGGEVCIIGAGAWGTALAQMAALAGNDVTLIGRSCALMSAINSSHTNQHYLGTQPLSSRIVAANDFSSLAKSDLVLLAVPAQATREMLETIPDILKTNRSVIVTAKGFETGTLALQSEVLGALWPGANIMVLSGPSFAVDVVTGRPSAVTLAGSDQKTVSKTVAQLASAYFRPYASNDLLGVQLAGGLKNVYALACGAVEGAKLGFSARSALIARAHAEMGRLIVKMGGAPETLGGLAGIGDLALSCTSFQSRNYQFGVELGRGGKVPDLLSQGLGLAEGVATAPVAKALAIRENVDMPLVDAVNNLLEGKLNIGEIVSELMTRKLKNEG